MHLIPGSPFNLISGNELLMEGYTVEGMIYKKGNVKLVFDIKVWTPKGVLLGICLERLNPEATLAYKPVVSKSLQRAHAELGHMGKQETKEVAKYFDWHLKKGQDLPCKSCELAKAKQKSLQVVRISKPPVIKERTTQVNMRKFLDITTLKNKKSAKDQPSRPNLRMIVDEATNFKEVEAFKKKNDKVEPTLRVIQGHTGPAPTDGQCRRKQAPREKRM